MLTLIVVGGLGLLVSPSAWTARGDMKSTYRVLAYIVAAEVVIQAAAIAYAFFALGKWIDDGATLNKTLMDNPNASYPGTAGLAIHGLNGEMLMPLLVLVLLVAS